ncbi:MAG TPA: baseplate J/gp47 family protein [Bacteroidia bacterium]|nr:baseplate J/gp47 family protein [Bacteroidia bacterium]
MSDNCNNKNALQRDGTSQSQRLLAALLPSYVSVDERSMEDLISFAKQFATEIQYYNLADAREGDWVAFFTKSISEEQRTEPHYALFIAFLELYKVAQDDINTITKRHLDYYYREVLNLEERAEVPDQVFIIFTLAEQLSSALVAKGKGLDAKKDDTGVDLVYKTGKDIVVNHGLVAQMKSVFINRPLDEAAIPLVYPDPIPVPLPGDPPQGETGGNNWRLYASPVANSLDGLGEALEGAEKRWRTFGTPKANSENKPDRPQAEVGFAFASPLLHLAEGTRTVKVRINFNRPLVSNPRALSYQALQAPSTVATMRLSNTLRGLPVAQHEAAIADEMLNQQSKALTGALNIYFSGEEEWIAPERINSVLYENNGDLLIECTISQAQKAVVAYNEEVLLQPIRTEWPVMKITLNTNDPATEYIYRDLSSKSIFTANLEVNVTGVRNLVIQNDDSVLSADKPFEPFGGQPLPDSAFYIGSTEIFQKQLDEVDVNITWHGLPNQRIPSGEEQVPKFPKGFTSYYENYLSPAEAQRRKNENFRVNAWVLDKRAWKSVNTSEEGFALFEPANDLPLDDNTQVIKINNGSLHAVRRNPKMEVVEEFGTEIQKGFLRLTLDSVDFGHSIFQNSYTQQAIWTVKDSQEAGSVSANQLKGAILGLPNDPYTPQIKEISVDYKSTETINLSRQVSGAANEKNYNARIEQFFHILPFGAAENHPHVTETVSDIPLLPQFPDEGSLYIGISSLEPPQVLSVLLKVAEGSSNPDFAKQPLKWSYLYNDEWYSFSQLQILSDSTLGLITSGIVTFDLPKAFNSTNTYLPEGLFWLKASVAHYSGAICDLIDVRAQAVTATYANNGNDPNHLRLALPADTIKDFVEGDSAIDSLSQPFASFGGRIKEQSDEFYVRVSERLRHKKRAITIWDYEHLVLEQFPKIYKVKCLNHTRYTSLNDVSELTPGHVSLVIIADLQNKNACDPLKPKTSLITLTEIQEYVNAIKPPCAHLHVRNPIFEEIQVEFQVKFLTGFDIGFYGQQLEEEIRQFLAPWTYGTKDIVFGGRIHKSMIINFVEDRPYVDFVTCFNMHQIVPTGLNTPPRILRDIDDAITTTSASILTSASTHLITVLETEDCACDDNLVLQPMLAPPVPCDDCGQPEDKVATGIGADEITTTFIIGHEPAAGVDFWFIEENFEVQ